MNKSELQLSLYINAISSPVHIDQDYFYVIKELVKLREEHPSKSQIYLLYQEKIEKVYDQVLDEINNNDNLPVSPVKFGTSGWRGIIGKDLYVKSVSIVTRAIVAMYKQLDKSNDLSSTLGVSSFAEAKQRGCVVGFDNRFGNELLAKNIIAVLTHFGFKVYFAGETSTGLVSASVMELGAAFSINLTPSHNPLEYGGFKFNASDAGPAVPEITNWITQKANELFAQPSDDENDPDNNKIVSDNSLIEHHDSLASWISLVKKGSKLHGLDYDQTIDKFCNADNISLVIDCVHGASRVHIDTFFKDHSAKNLTILRKKEDPTFSGISPEPSTENLKKTVNVLKESKEQLKLGVILDPDADRIRFTDGINEIDMNLFGAMAYHYLHEIKGKRGMVAKTVATSNFANQLAAAFNEEVYEPRVGFKEFKPVINKALVSFEESDGITVIGHTPEKDGYIGLLLAIDMVLTLQKNLGDYLKDIQDEYGYFFPAKDGVTVSESGDSLNSTLSHLTEYQVGTQIVVGNMQKTIIEVISIDGYKMILDDGSWLMIRASGTEPKVRFYVEARDAATKDSLFVAARDMLEKLGLI